MTSVHPLLIGLCLCLGLGAPESVAKEDAVPKHELEAHYDIYLGGMRVADAALTATVGKTAYDINWVLETRGFFHLFRMQANMSAKARGARPTGGQLSPESYSSDYATGDDAATLHMTYEEDTPSVAAEPPIVPASFRTREEDRSDTLDPLSALLAMMVVGEGEEVCNRRIPVFDGTRRYDILLLPEEKRPTKKSFQALKNDRPVARCFGLYERISGFETAVEKDRKYYPFDIWFDVSGTGTNPILRIASESKLGHVIGILRR